MPRIPHRFLRKCLTTLVALGAIGAFSGQALAKEITVFAAASLTNAIKEAAHAYEQASGDKVRLSLASSSTLAQQIAAGAPADIYISANEKWMDWLADQKLINTNSRHDLLVNSLVLIAPNDSDIAASNITASTNLLGMISPDDRIAVGDPDHVPAGMYAKQALTSLGQWDGVNPRLARADNVRAALALVERGEAPLGIVYRTDADISDAVKIIGTFPADSHPAITYPVAMVSGPNEKDALKLLLWLLGDDAGKIFADYGFDPITPMPAGLTKK